MIAHRMAYKGIKGGNDMWSQSVRVLNPYEALAESPKKSEKEEKNNEAAAG